MFHRGKDFLLQANQAALEKRDGIALHIFGNELEASNYSPHVGVKVVEDPRC